MNASCPLRLNQPAAGPRRRSPPGRGSVGRPHLHRKLLAWLVLALGGGCTLVHPELASQRWEATPGTEQAPLAQWTNPDLTSRQGGLSTMALRWAASQEDVVTAANATLLLLKRGQRVDPAPLQKAVLDAELALPMRRAALAAVEALPENQRVSVLVELLRELNRQGGQGLPHAATLQREALAILQRMAKENPARFQQDETIRELIWGDSESRLAGAAASSEPQVVVAALSFWSALDRPLPPQATRLAEHPHRQVRLALLQAARGSPELLWQSCDRLLASGDPQLQQEAARQLGHLAATAWEQQARQRLERLLRHQGELLRAAAAEALAAWNDTRLLARAEQDRSWRVRRSVAGQLGRLPPRQARPMALRLLEDPSPLVQLAVVEAIAAWPPPWSVPVWCQGLQSDVYSTRAAAKEHLARHIPAAKHFPLGAPQPHRRRLAQELLQKWLAEHRDLRTAEESGQTPATAETEQPLPEPVARRLADLFRQARHGFTSAEEKAAWRAALLEHRQMLPQWLEQQLLVGQNVEAMLDQELLLALGGAYRLLAQWGQASPPERRTLARELRSLATQGRLGPVVHSLLARHVDQEQDPLVWQAVLQALAGEESAWAVQIARVGIAHADPEVRRQACLYLRDHPQPEHFPWLAQRAHDAHVPVVLAAIEALGRCDHPEATAVLKHLLLNPEGAVQVAAAAALARHDPEQGRRALERLCWHPQWQVRRQAAVALAQQQQRESVPVLLHLLDDVAPVRQAALQGLSRCSGLTPPQEVQLQGTPALVRWWKQQLTGPEPAPRAGSDTPR